MINELLELRTFWELQARKLCEKLESATTQVNTESAALDSENAALHEVGRRVVLAEQKYKAAVDYRASIADEIYRVKQTIELLHKTDIDKIFISCRGCGIKAINEPSVRMRTDNEYRCNDCAQRIGVR